MTTTPGTRPALKARAGAEREDEHVGHDGHVQPGDSEPTQQLVVLAGVVAGLVDDKARPGVDLAPQLRVLGHELAFVALWLVTTAPKKKFVGFMARPVASSKRPRFMSAYIDKSPTESMSKLGRAMPP